MPGSERLRFGSHGLYTASRIITIYHEEINNMASERTR